MRRDRREARLEAKRARRPDGGQHAGVARRSSNPPCASPKQSRTRSTRTASSI
jgi:hypothetical protein